MKKLLFAAAALLGTTAATAQVAPAQGQARDGIQTRAEAVERVRTMFARVDQDRDGAITATERQAIAGQMRQQRTARMANRSERMFERIDTNKDRMISQAEWAGAQAQRAQRMAERGQRMGQQVRQRAGGGMLRAADANNDQRVTLQEAEAAALRRFDRVDANRDGQITREERRQVRQQRGAVRR